MRRILFIQPYRYGDILQAQPVVRSVKRKFPDAQVWFVADDSFCEILKNSENDKVLVYPRAAVIRAVKARNDIENGIDYCGSFLDELMSVEFDAVINFNYSDTPSFIAWLAASGKKFGRILDENGAIHINGFWSRYLLFFTAARRYNRLNLVEMFYRITEEALGLEAGELYREKLFYKPSENSAVRVEKWMQAHSLGKKPMIGLQVGASKKSKMKLNPKFPELCFMLSEAGYDCVLFGGPGEKKEAEKIIGECKTKVFSSAGEFDMEDNFSMLKKLELFITSDTLNMHLAGAAGTKTLVVDYGDIFPWETTAHAPGVYVAFNTVSCWPCDDADVCTNMKCVSEISADALYCAALAAISGGGKMEIKHDLELMRSELNLKEGFSLKLVSGKMDAKTLADEIFRDIYLSYWENIFNAGKNRRYSDNDAVAAIWEKFGKEVRINPEREREMAVIFKKRLTAYAALNTLVSDALIYIKKIEDGGIDKNAKKEAKETLEKILQKILDFDRETAMLKAYFSVEENEGDKSLASKAENLGKLKYALSSFVYAVAYIMQKMYEDTFVGGEELIAL